MKKEIILNKLKKKLKKLSLEKVIVFGSIITDNFNEDSDLDIVVVLKKKGFSKNYDEVLKNKLYVHKSLRELKKDIAIDLYVFTIDEWNYLLKNGGSFFKEISTKGLELFNESMGKLAKIS